jgi:ABC-type lipoprotein export system ATPase subunit
VNDKRLVVETAGLTKTFGDGSGVRAREDIDLAIREGEFVAVMGPSGSGKSTLLNLLGALDRPTRGICRVDGRDLAQIGDLDRFRAKTVGFVFQLHNLIPTLTSVENVELPLGEKMSHATRRARAVHVLSLVGLADRLHVVPGQLSGGQRQRVAIARALANEPAIVLADEPTGSLDSRSTEEIVQVMRRLIRDAGTTFVIVTHNPAVARAAERIVTLRDGRVLRDERVENGYVEDLREFKASSLGHALLDDTLPAELRGTGLEEISTQLRAVLERA